MPEERVVDYIMQFLCDQGIKDVFTLTGGGAMFLNDGIACNPELNAICNHHEQASAMAAVGYAKYLNDFAAVVVTSGCGATNTMTGLLDAWQDSAKGPAGYQAGTWGPAESSHLVFEDDSRWHEDN